MFFWGKRAPKKNFTLKVKRVLSLLLFFWIPGVANVQKPKKRKLLKNKGNLVLLEKREPRK